MISHQNHQLQLSGSRKMAKIKCSKIEGTVTKTEANMVSVSVIQNSACAGCHAAGACNSSDSSEKIIDLYAEGYSVGDRVNVSVKESDSFFALALGYLFPLGLILLTVLILSAFTENQVMIALVALATLVPYYVVVYLLRGRISKKVEFIIESK